MSSCIGNVLRLSIFGQSHSPAIGCTLDGLPAGIPVDLAKLQRFLDRRAPGRSATATSRREADAPEVLSGITDGHTNGAPFAAIIRNTNTRSQDYAGLRRVPRPGHADYPARVKYGNWHDVAGGGHFSGRLTAPLCIAGGIALQALEGMGVHIAAHIASLGPEGIEDEPLNPLELDEEQLGAILANELPCISAATAARMQEAILTAKRELDSVGGVIECAAYGMPVGVGDPMFEGNREPHRPHRLRHPRGEGRRVWCRLLRRQPHGQREQRSLPAWLPGTRSLSSTAQAASSAASPPACPSSGAWP